MLFPNNATITSLIQETERQSAMLNHLRLSIAFLLVTLFCTILVAQENLGTLVVGQAVINDVTTETPVLRYNFVVDQPSSVTIQAFGQAAQPTLSIMNEGAVVASEPNVGGVFSITLTSLLNAGTYSIEVGTVNSTTGSIATVIASATPITATELTLGTIVNGQIDQNLPVMFYRFTALTERSSLRVVTGAPFGGAVIRLFNETANIESAMIGTDLMGASLEIAPNGFSYRLEISYNSINPTVPYALCWTSASAPACSNDSTAIQATPVNDAACSVTPTGSAVNVRSSASVSAPQIGALNNGTSAPVLGIAPDNSFYNIAFNNVSGWVATSVVISSGDCANVPVVNPPAFTPVATTVPTQTPTAIPIATATPLPTPSGPCLLTLTSPTYVYTIPNNDISNLYDQVQSGQLIPTGKLADNSWWKTNYANAWIETSTFGVSVTVSGNCGNLPVVAP